MVLVVVVGLLAGLGVVMVYSASSVAAVESSGSSWTIVARQIGWLLVGVAIAALAARVPLQRWRDAGGVMLLVALGGLLFLAVSEVLGRIGVGQLPFAIEVNGATRWIGQGALRFQPSELAKPALVLWAARLMTQPRRDLSQWEGVRPVVIAFGVTAVLVMAGDDLGTTLLLGVVVLTMLLLGGAHLRFLAGVTAGLGSLAVFSLLVLEQFRLDRIAAFLSPGEHATDAAWQATQARIGLASGGVFGSGPGYSRAKWGFLPEAHTDFILAVIGEELGMVGTVAVIALFVAFIATGTTIALRCEDRFGQLVAFGVTAWLGVQALINIGVAVGTLPTKGITLPFVSYGGSSMLISMLGVGMLLSVARSSTVRASTARAR